MKIRVAELSLKDFNESDIVQEMIVMIIKNEIDSDFDTFFHMTNDSEDLDVIQNIKVRLKHKMCSQISEKRLNLF